MQLHVVRKRLEPCWLKLYPKTLKSVKIGGDQTATVHPSWEDVQIL